jgi:hypothetical protein
METIPLIQEINLEDNSNLKRDSQGYKEHPKNKLGILNLDMSLLNIRKLDGKEIDEYIYIFGAKSSIILFARGMYELCSDEYIDSIDKWKNKLQRAYRLFNFAWAVGEDGCDKDKNNKNKFIRPHFNQDKLYQEVETEKKNNRKIPEEVLSVRDIYPHRQSEIADLGKVLAIASSLIWLYLLDQKEKENLKSEIEYLKNGFYGDESRNDSIKFNGHLRDYFEFIKKETDEEIEKIENEKKIPNIQGMKTIRERILKTFFNAFDSKNRSTSRK